MVLLQIGDQTIRYDSVATASIYLTISQGDAETCGCSSCRNFATQREDAYPESFRELLNKLGVDYKKEGEVYEYGPIADGRHLYGGWFYLVGELVLAGERNISADDFEFYFTTHCPRSLAFDGWPTLAIEFCGRMKWLLPNE